MARDLRPSPAGVSAWLWENRTPNADYIYLLKRTLGCADDDLYENGKFSGSKLAKLMRVKKMTQSDLVFKMIEELGKMRAA